MRRVNIPKPNGKTRALGIPTGPDKLLQEVIRMILEAYYEPQFSDRSHGFRPGRGCHTALGNVVNYWSGVRWLVEGDIKGCFDNIDHDVLLSVLGEKLHDNRFLRLLKCLLKAGYVEDWKYGRTLSGTPQGGIVSPVLANVYLDRLDKFVENVLIHAHTRGTDRRANREYTRLSDRMAYHRKVGHHSLAAELRKQMQQLPSGDPHDPDYRRLRYVRYADDFVLGYIGPKAEAQQVKESLETFLRDSLKLELSTEKTLITHATSQAARFLGYELVNQQANDQFDSTGRRRFNGRIGLRVPTNVIEQHCQAYMLKGKPAHRSYLVHDEDYSIVEQYQSEFRGVVQYYLPASNVSHFGRLRAVMERSLARTLAAKHKSTARKMRRKYKSVVETEHGLCVCLRVIKQQDNGKRPLVAYFGGIPLKRQRQAVLVDQHPQRYRADRTELIQRLLADECEMCDSTVDVEVHHIRALRDLNVKGQREKPKWVQLMAARKRKTLVVCWTCHMDIHHGRINPQKQT